MMTEVERLANAKFRKTEKFKLGQSRWRRSINGRFRLIKIAADRRSLPFTLTKEELKSIIGNGTCSYCGSQIGGGGGVDRLDLNPSVGYTHSNLIACCRECNVIKNNLLSHEEMLELVKLLKTMRKTEEIWSSVKWRKGST